MNRVKIYRKKYNLTVQELADKLHISRSFMSQIENGSRNISNDLLMRMCSLFNCDAMDLLGAETYQINDNLYTDEEISFLNAFKTLDDNDKMLLTEFINYLIFKHKENIRKQRDMN